MTLFFRSENGAPFDNIKEPTKEHMQIAWPDQQVAVLLKQSMATSTALTHRAVFVIWFPDSPFEEHVKVALGDLVTKEMPTQTAKPLCLTGEGFSILYFLHVRHLLFTPEAFAKTTLLSSAIKRLVWKLFSVASERCFACVMITKRGTISISAGSMNLSSGEDLERLLVQMPRCGGLQIINRDRVVLID